MKRQERNLSRRRAFTLIELLTSIAILGILASLSATSLSSAKQRTRRVHCQGSLRQLMLASLMYADDDRGGYFSNTFSDSDNNLNHLYPHYLPDRRIFSCAGTRNFIRPSLTRRNPYSGDVELVDLADIASSRTGPGSSYEIFGFMNYNGGTATPLRTRTGWIEAPGIKKSIHTVQRYPHQHETFGLKGHFVGPADIWLILDADAVNNFPDAADNHGRAGGNVGHCDGSVRWIRRADYLRAYETSQDEGRRR